MKETQFKALMHCGQYVDANQLERGIYTCSKPFLYDKHETIKTMIDTAIKVQDMMGKHHITEKYFDNLKQCQLTPILITEVINDK